MISWGNLRALKVNLNELDVRNLTVETILKIKLREYGFNSIGDLDDETLMLFCQSVRDIASVHAAGLWAKKKIEKQIEIPIDNYQLIQQEKET